MRLPSTLAAGRVAGLVLALSACTRAPDSASAPPTTKMSGDRYVKRAIRQSNEGVILLPSEKAERVYELPRLNEIAHALREPAALCFLSRAINTMERSADDERGFVGVPEGQVKIRARIAPSGEVLRTEVLETGFADATMPACVEKAIVAQQFPQNDGGVNHYIDVVYWVSLGMQGDVHTAEWKAHVRREQVAAGVRAKPCLQGRTPIGSYRVHALNLVDREGGTLVNRIDGGGLPADVRPCVARAFRDLRLPRVPEAFVRPVWAEVELTVRRDGGIEVGDEEWLRRVELEERVKRAEQRKQMLGGDVGDGSRWTEDTTDVVDDAAVDEGEPPADVPKAEPAKPRTDPGKGGIKLDLGTRPRTDAGAD